MFYEVLRLLVFAAIPVLALFLFSVIAIPAQWRHFNQPALPPGAKRRMQWPLWIWIPLIAIVSLEGWRIRTGDANTEARDRAEAADFVQQKQNWQKVLDALLVRVRAGETPHEQEIEDFLAWEASQQVLMDAMPAALADESESVQRFALRYCEPALNQRWEQFHGAYWFEFKSTGKQAKLLEALRAYEQDPKRPEYLRREARTAADWLATQIRQPNP